MDKRCLWEQTVTSGGLPLNPPVRNSQLNRVFKLGQSRKLNLVFKLFFVFKLGQSRKLFFVCKLGQSRKLFLVFKLGQPRKLFLFSKFCLFSKHFQFSKPNRSPRFDNETHPDGLFTAMPHPPLPRPASAAKKNLSWLSGGARRILATTRQRPPPTGVRGLRGAVPAGAVNMRWVTDHFDNVKAKVTACTLAVDVDTTVSLYDAYLALVTATDDARRQRNLVASRMRIEAAKMTPDVRAEVIAQCKALKASVTSLESRLAQAESVVVAEAANLPNRTHPEVPFGGDDAAKTLRTVGAPRDFRRTVWRRARTRTLAQTSVCLTF